PAIAAALKGCATTDNWKPLAGPDDLERAAGRLLIGVARHQAAVDDFRHLVEAAAGVGFGMRARELVDVGDVVLRLPVGRHALPMPVDRVRPRVVGGERELLVVL